MTDSCIILGTAGAGKSTLVEELRRNHGRLAFDADDEIPGLARWYDADGRPVEDYNSSDEWRDRHQYLWNIEVLKGFMQAQRQRNPNQVLYIAGTTTNYEEAVEPFEHRVVLDVEPSMIRQRLASPDRKVNYPVDIEHREEWLAERLPEFRANWSRIGAIALDAQLPSDVLASGLIKLVEGSPAMARLALSSIIKE